MLTSAIDVFRNLSQKYRGNDVSSESKRRNLLSDEDSIVDELIDTNKRSIILAGVPGCAKTLRFLVAQDRIARKQKERVLPIYVDCMEVMRSVPKYEQFLLSLESDSTEKTQRLFEADIVFRLIKSMTASAKAFADRNRSKKKLLDWMLKPNFIHRLETDIDDWIRQVEEKRGEAGGLAFVTDRAIGKESVQSKSIHSVDSHSSTERKKSASIEASLNLAGQLENQIPSGSGGLVSNASTQRSFDDVKSQAMKRSKGWETDMSEDKEFMRLYHQHADLLIKQFLNVLAKNDVQTVIFFFDEFSEATFGGREFVGRVIQALNSCTTEQQIGRCIRIATYPGDVTRAETLIEGTIVRFVDPLSRTLTKPVLSSEKVECEGGLHLKNVFERAFDAAGLSIENVFNLSSPESEDELFRHLHIFGGGSVRIISRHLSQLEEDSLPITLGLLRSFRARWLDDHISKADFLIGKRAGLQKAEEKAETADALLRVEYVRFADRMFREFATNFDSRTPTSTRFLFFPRSIFEAEGLDAALEYGLCYLLGSIHSTEHREPVMVAGISACFFPEPEALNYHIIVSETEIDSLARDSWELYEIARLCVTEKIEEEKSQATTAIGSS